MQRSIIPVIGLFCVASSCAKVKPPAPEPTTTTAETPAATELYFIDGREATKEEVAQLARDRIASIEVIKGNAAIARCGTRGEHGIVDVTTVDARNRTPSLPPNHVYLIDGRAATIEQVRCLRSDTIESVEMIKGAAALRYGGEPGVALVRVTTKRAR